MNQGSRFGTAGWQSALGLFALCQGVKFLAVNNLFLHYRSYQYLATQPLRQDGWAVMLCLYAFAAFFVVWRPTPLLKAWVTVVGAAMWLYLGVEMMLGSWMYNVWTSDGLFEVCAGIGCVVVITRARSNR